MQEITIHFQQMNGSIQPEFITQVAALAKEYGIIINSENPRDVNEDERKRSLEEFIYRASEISKRIGPVDTDSAQFLRSLRDTV